MYGARTEGPPRSQWEPHRWRKKCPLLIDGYFDLCDECAPTCGAHPAGCYLTRPHFVGRGIKHVASWDEPRYDCWMIVEGCLLYHG